jgi:hypothetical protein
VSGPDDPEAYLCATYQRLSGTYQGKSNKAENTSGPYVPTAEQLVVTPSGLTHKQLRRFYQQDLDGAIGNDE